MNKCRERVTGRFPVYYGEFACTGSDCEMTCCACWNISADKDAMENYKGVKGGFGKRLRSSIDREGNFLQREGRCPFLNRENLCDIYIHLGKDKLCKTCRIYPRHVEIYGSLHEVSLSLSCPAAAELVLYRRGADAFTVRRGRYTAERLEKTEEKLLTELEKVRDAMLQIMGNRRDSVEHRMAKVLALGHDGQRRLGRKESLTGIIERYTEEADSKFAERLTGILHKDEQEGALEPGEGHLKKRRALLCLYLELTSGLEPVVGDWKLRTGRLMERLYGMDTDAEQYETWRRGTEAENVNYSVYMEHLMNYFLYIYVPGAVYDGDLYSKVKLALFSCLIIREMNIGTYAENGAVSRQDGIKNACLYSRELEHSDANLSAVARLLSRHPALRLEELLYCI